MTNPQNGHRTWTPALDFVGKTAMKYSVGYLSWSVVVKCFMQNISSKHTLLPKSYHHDQHLITVAEEAEVLRKKTWQNGHS